MMGHYSLLRLDWEGEVAGFSTVRVSSDTDALAYARFWTGERRPVEVWKGPRLVGTVIAPTSK